MRILLTVVVLGLVALEVLAQNDGRYRPINIFTSTPRNIVSDGRYRGGNDGRYRPVNDGKYKGGNDGRYVHMDVKYTHDDRKGGLYTGESDPYRGAKDRFGPGGGAGSRSGGSAFNNILPSTTRRPGASTLVVPGIVNNLQKGRGTSLGSGDDRIIRLENDIDQDGYHYLYETENGILTEESGRIEKLATEDGLRSTGFFEYTGDDGNLYRVDYVADDNGFVPRGTHIPTPPPYVAKLLAYLEANAPKK